MDDWARYLGVALSGTETALLEQHLRTGRPLGGERFIAQAEATLKRSLRKQRPGRKPKPSIWVYCPHITPPRPI